MLKIRNWGFLQMKQSGVAMKRTLIIVAALATLIGTPALAADMALKAPPPPPPAPSWTGFYIGVHAGGGWNRGNLRADYLPFPTFGVNPTLATSTGSGALGGGQVGYNWQAGPNWVVGVEGDISKTGINSTLIVIPTAFATGLPIPA